LYNENYPGFLTEKGDHMKRLISIAISLTLGLFASAAMAADLDAVVEGCNGCHGDNGVSQWTDVPTIAGISEFVHSDALYIFRDEARPCTESEYRQGDTSKPATTMCAVTAELSDDMIDEIAAHYAGLPFVAAKQDFDADLAAAGKAIHDAECDRCHSEGGANPEDDASILAGQQMGYLEDTLAEYRAGEREQPKKMEEKLNALSDDDVKALVHYYASQQ
jgi:cytochrome subunit of sulfide dehydrogenase